MLIYHKQKPVQRYIPYSYDKENDFGITVYRRMLMKEIHDDGITWKRFPQYWLFVMVSTHKDQVLRTFDIILSWTEQAVE